MKFLFGNLKVLSVVAVPSSTSTKYFGHTDSRHMVATRLQKMVEEREEMMGKTSEQKRRPITTNVKFSIGMVMKHKR